jgi:hypothetical protein
MCSVCSFLFKVRFIFFFLHRCLANIAWSPGHQNSSQFLHWFPISFAILLLGPPEPISSAVVGGLAILVASFVLVFLGARKRQAALEQGGLVTSESLHV